MCFCRTLLMYRDPTGFRFQVIRLLEIGVGTSLLPIHVRLAYITRSARRVSGALGDAVLPKNQN